MEEIILYLKSKKHLLAIVFLTLLFAALILYPLYFLKKPMAQTKSKISVEVAGAVNKPGLFSLNPDNRVSDAIALAGGITKDADQDFVNSMLNQARQLEDGEKIFIPQKAVAATTTQKATSATTASSTTNGQVAAGQIVNINTASLDELDTLPGIGPAYAQRIIDYRTQNNGFKSINTIQDVKGIGPITFEKLKDLITI